MESERSRLAGTNSADRGHTGAFLILCFCATVFAALVTSFFHQFQIEFLLPQWGSPDHEYLLRFRPVPVFIWKTWQVFGSPVMASALTTGALLGAYAIQRRLSRASARRLLLMIGVTGFFGLAAAAFPLFGLLLRPLC